MSKRGKVRGGDKKKEKEAGVQVPNSKFEIRNGDGGGRRPIETGCRRDIGQRARVREGRYGDARSAYLRLARGFGRSTNPRLRALVQNDLAVLDAMEGKLYAAVPSGEQWSKVTLGACRRD